MKTNIKYFAITMVLVFATFVLISFRGIFQLNPESSAIPFYLAMSYQATDDHQKAIDKYDEYLSKNGDWSEEAWYSKYMQGQCYHEMGQWEKAFNCYLDAYAYNPDRAEPLYEIAKHYRANKQYDFAYFFAKQAASIPYPSHGQLFVSNPIYDYLIDQEISIAAYYTPYYEDGFNSVNRLILSKKAPDYVRNYAYQNVLYYIEPIENVEYQPIVFNLPLLRENQSQHFNPMNPTIKKTDDGYAVICRTVNYFQYGGKFFVSMDIFDPTSKIITKNFLLKYDCEFNLLSQQEIIENLQRNHFNFINCVGLEDCRMFLFNESIWFTCTTLDTNPCRAHQISLCKLEDKGIDNSINVERLIPLMGPNLKRCEKNWLPFVKNNEIFAIYSYDPFVIYKLKNDEQLCSINNNAAIVNEPQKLNFTRFCGSAPPIEFNDGYLFLVHEVAYAEDRRHYMHRFLYMDRDLNITKASSPFFFMHKGIEYCCGMTIDHANENLVMTIGIEDRQAFFAFVDINTVKDMLRSTMMYE
jgi:tetratricopeptide (TPR) repeat protein